MTARSSAIIVVVLAIALVGVWLWVLGAIPFKRRVRELTERPGVVEVTPEELRERAEATARSLSSWLEEQEKLSRTLVYHKGRRDPFLLLVKKKKESPRIEPPKLVLKGIAWDKTEPLALINNLVVREGDTIEGARIVKIDFDRVLVRHGRKEFLIKLIEEKEKTES